MTTRARTDSANFTVCSVSSTHTRKYTQKLFCLNWIDERDFLFSSMRKMFAKRKYLLARFVSEKWFLFVIYYLLICLANPSCAMKVRGDKKGWNCWIKGFHFRSMRRRRKFIQNRNFCFVEVPNSSKHQRDEISYISITLRRLENVLNFQKPFNNIK